MKSRPLKVAVLISGHGSNLKAMLDAIAEGRLQMEIVRVLSNRADAGGIAHARAAGVAVSISNHTAYPDRQAHDHAILRILERDQVQLVVLAGYMRVLGEAITQRFNGSMINLHPSLLPRHKGLDTYNRALRAGDSETGASIHFVTAGLDAGPLIAQVRMPILATDDATSLANRLGPLEHQLLLATLELFCQHQLSLASGQVFYRGHALEKPLQLQADGRIGD